VCNGSLTETERSSAPTCHLCGHIESTWSCPKCKGAKVRATVVGSVRTAEELGRAFPGVAVRNSSSDHILRDVDSRPAIVVATAGAAPVAQGGYSAAILLDGNSMLSRPDLGASQETYAKWNECVSLVRADGEVVVVADSELPAVQALIRQDPAGFAAREYEQRTQVQLPPAVRLAVLSGAQIDIDDVIQMAAFADGVALRGPVPGKAGQVRMLITVEKQGGLKLAETLKAVTTARSAKRKGAQVNVRIDPPSI
jgi:primosomal protein N' (replication factor Y)